MTPSASGNNTGDTTGTKPDHGAQEPYVAEALRIAFPSSLPAEYRFVVIFTAYIDESGTHDGAQALTVAGYISTSDLWEQFDAHWRSALADLGIDFFHMTDFAHFTQQFTGWDEQKRRDALTRLIGVINEHVLGSFSMSLVRSEYAEVFGTGPAHQFAGGPYGIAATMCFLNLSELLDDIGVFGQIAYVFESGAAGHGQVLQTWQSNYADPGQRERLRLLSLTFADKRLFTPLQAADILAYELYREVPRVVGLTSRARRYPLGELSDVPADWARVDLAELKRWERIINIRLGLDESQVVKSSPITAYRGPMVAISQAEFQARWRWFRRFRARTTRSRAGA